MASSSTPCSLKIDCLWLNITFFCSLLKSETALCPCVGAPIIKLLDILSLFSPKPHRHINPFFAPIIALFKSGILCLVSMSGGRPTPFAMHKASRRLVVPSTFMPAAWAASTYVPVL